MKQSVPASISAKGQELFALAFQAHQAGQIDDAARLYRQVLVANPRHADSLNLLGVLSSQFGDTGSAVDLIGRAIAIDAANPAYRYNLGVILGAAGRLEEAALSYRQAIARHPNHRDALFNLGNVLAALELFDEAIACYHQVLAIDPAHVSTLVNLGATLTKQGRMDEAELCYRKAIAVNPENANAHYNLGKLVQERGDNDEAVGHYEATLKCQPDFVDALSNLGNTLLALGRLDEAVAACNKAVSLKPDFAEAYVNLAAVLRTLHRLEEALAACEMAVRWKPDLATAHLNLGYTLQELGRVEDATAALEAAIHLEPENLSTHTALIMNLHYQRSASEMEIYVAARRFGTQIEVASKTQFINSPEPGRRLRVGYVSGDFKQHAVGFFIAAILANHDRENVETYAYSCDSRNDWLAEQLRTHCAHWRDVARVSDHEMSALVAADGIDILVDLSGHTAYNRLRMFAERAAPVQVTWLGFWGTTGLSSIDYILSDATMIPEGDEDKYSETVFRLPVSRFCYMAPYYAPASAAAPCLGNGYVTFGSFNNLTKIGADVIQLWARLLHAVPDARLLLKWFSLGDGMVREKLFEAFADLGIGPERLILRSTSPHADMLAEYGDVDIALDPFPFSGGATSCEALWMGVPMVTLPGTRAVSRQTLGFLRAIGLPELAAASADEYVRIASSLAADMPRLAALRETLRERMASSPLCDGPAFTRDLEAAYRTMWQAWCEKATSHDGA